MKPLFGANIDPSAGNLHDIFARTAAADRNGYDLVMSQDHPYNRHFLDTWTMLAFLAARTENVHLGTNVANLPLRPPAMLAKQAASLDILSGGRVELGIGAGAFWKGITAYGGPDLSEGGAYSAFKEALTIIQKMWGDTWFSFDGEYYQLKGTMPGPRPAHDIPIWVGALGPKMLHLVGQQADGVLVSTSYVPREKLGWVHEQIDGGAAEAGRPTTAIRRGYNLMGNLTRQDGAGWTDKGGFIGSSTQWTEMLLELYHEYRMDTFLIWPGGDDTIEQIERFGQEVIPAVKEQIGE
jgi:alkanesulfonate monooxygenase SsuD/methylene tetrahydromethanopterin reductase-like flavin-dependent oxidoreductase (luciferase family)